MTPFSVVRGRAAVLDRANVDTDQIIPARFLRQPRSAGYERFLFYDLPETRSAIKGAVILLAGPNFGCGSSREGAVYALADAGVRCVIAPSFGDIFAGNAAQNGLLLVTLPTATLNRVREVSLSQDLIVDLPAQMIASDAMVPHAVETEAVRMIDNAPERIRISFDMDTFSKRRLVEGLDDIALTLTHASAIAAWESADAEDRVWVKPAG